MTQDFITFRQYDWSLNSRLLETIPGQSHQSKYGTYLLSNWPVYHPACPSHLSQPTLLLG